MIKGFHAAAAALVIGASLSTPALAGPIESACNRSERKAANRQLCACIQKVADATLSSSDQRRGAAFFADPGKSQEVRTSDRRSDEEFWLRWKSFGETAEYYCR